MRRVGAVAVVLTSRSTQVGLEREEGPLGCGPEEKRRSSRRRRDRWVRHGGEEERLEKEKERDRWGAARRRGS
eukprot:2575541-Rhodomonas_salina.1